MIRIKRIAKNTAWTLFALYVLLNFAVLLES